MDTFAQRFLSIYTKINLPVIRWVMLAAFIWMICDPSLPGDIGLR